MIAINKADGENVARAKAAAAEYRNALHILSPKSETWSPPVITVSGATNQGLDELWKKVVEHRDLTLASGEFAQRRQRQAVAWMRDMLEERLMAALNANSDVARELPQIEAEVRAGKLLPTLAVERVISLMGMGRRG